MGIQRWDCRAEENEGGGLFVNDFECDGGRYVLFTDHEQVVAELTKDHQDNLDSWLHQREEIAFLRAELAAKSKDAERYRWLQMQSPYRFKKIQDACVIDSVDVLYFKADRFDELLDTAMGEGNDPATTEN